MTTPPRPFERVLAVTDYFDHPRRGVAYFDGRPHGYELVFGVERDEYEVDLYDLRTVDGEPYLLLGRQHLWRTGNGRHASGDGSKTSRGIDDVSFSVTGIDPRMRHHVGGSGDVLGRQLLRTNR